MTILICFVKCRCEGQALFDNDSDDDAKHGDSGDSDEDLQEGVPPVPSIGVIK